MDASLKEKLLGEYQVRKTAAQKQRFGEFVLSYCSAHGLKAEIETVGKSTKSRNIIIGDVNSADTVFTAHYDTCAVMPMPNFITPLNMPLYLLYQVAILLPVAAAALLMRWLLGTINTNLGNAGAILVVALFLVQIMAGIANKHTANDNTSGVAAVLEAAAKMSEEGRKKTAFVLFDNEESGMKGSSAFFAAHKDVMQKKAVINFDCVSDGDNVMLGRSKTFASMEGCADACELLKGLAAEKGKTLVLPEPGKGFYPSDQSSFPCGLSVAALRNTRRGLLYMNRIHTPRDTVFDEVNIDLLADWACAVTAQGGIRPLSENPKMPKLSKKILIFAISVIVGFLLGLLIGGVIRPLF